MSVLNQSGEEQVECPLCMEPLEVDDLHFYPCTCGYQICRFCWNRIREGESGLCPACRKAYPENPADFTPLSQEQVAAIKTEKRAREQKRRNKTLESRRALANVRVVQNNLVFVVGLPVRLADPETLKRQDYFGKYGKIHKVVINQSTAYAGSQGPSASAYVTYVSPADALRAIQGVNNVSLDGRVLKGSLGTTKYCANFMKNQPCPKADCMYLHELGDPKASFTKEEMHAGLHQVYERKLHNQLLASTQAQQQQNSSGNPSTSAEKGSSKEGNPSNFIPTTVVTSSNINIVNSSKSKRDSGSANGNGASAGSGNSSNINGNKEAWPSLGSSPPTADSPTRKQSSPKPHQNVKSQENGTSESNSPTQQSHKKNSKENHTTENGKTSRSNKENNSTNNNQTRDKKSKNTDSQKAGKQRMANSISEDAANELDESDIASEEISSVNETNQAQQMSYLSNELDELESDRHSLLENHELLENSDHSLLDDDNTHNLLDANSDIMIMQRHKDMLAGLVDSNHLMQTIKSSPLVNGFSLLDNREPIGYLANDRQISQNLMEKGAMRGRNEMLMRQNEMLARQQHSAMVEPKHYMPTSNLALESNELIGANYHPNPNMLPFGMRVDSSMAANSIAANSLTANNMTGNTMGMNSLTPNSIASSAYMMHNQHLLQQNQQHPMQQNALVNGFDASQTNQQAEGRYLAENMDKFFTDFHKAQQMRLLVSREAERRAEAPRARPQMLSAERLEMEHKHRLGMSRVSGEGAGARAAGDGDDDLDFDPFKETQKALAEMMETEMMQNSLITGDNLERVRRPRLPPPGFGHMNAFGIGVPRAQPHHQAFTSPNSMFADWTQMDPAIVSTSVNFPKTLAPPPSALSQQQQELFARFNQLGVQPAGAAPAKLWGAPYAVPLPPGFAPAKPPQHSECIDAK